MKTARLIDTDHLDLYIAGDDALRDEILEIFAEQARSWSDILDPQAGDPAWHDAAHALKGAARGVGAWPLGDQCEQAEAMIGLIEAKQEQRADLLDRLRATVADTLAEIRRLRSPDMAGGKTGNGNAG